MWKLALLVALVGCGKKADETKSDKPAKPDKTGTIDAAPKSAEDLFTGKVPTMPAPVAKITFGMPEADAKAAAPDVFAEKYGYKVPGYDGVEINVQIEDGRVYQTRMEIKKPIDVVKGWLTAKWGEPRADKNAINNPEYYWEAPDVGLRAMLETSASNSMLRFDPVMSIEQVLGTDPKLFGLEKAPFIGATQEDILKQFEIYRAKPRDNDPASIAVTLPALAGDKYGTTVDWRVKDGKVSGFSLSIPSMFTDKLGARLEQMFGAGKIDSTQLYTEYTGPPKVKAELRKDAGFS
jgi:hypothetical protein